jgi:hypothetical protein
LNDANWTPFPTVIIEGMVELVFMVIVYFKISAVFLSSLKEALT